MLEQIMKDVFSIQTFSDKSCDLLGVIVVDKKHSYPAIGGTRLMEYSSIEEAITDAIRLAKNMTLKCILSEVEFFGGKSVLLRPKNIDKNRYFSSYADVINGFNGRFITGCDFGVDQNDMIVCKEKTPYITGLSTTEYIDYLSYLTALGVLEAIKLGLSYKDIPLSSAKISIQGIGKVGFELANLLQQQGANLTICDLNEDRAIKIAKALKCNVVNHHEIYSLKSDVFSPCGLGDIINEKTVPALNCKLICGAANNQIHDQKILKDLDDKNILYVPDWICNIGGTIYAAHSYLNDSIDFIKNKVTTVINHRTQEFLDLKLTKGKSSLESLDTYINFIEKEYAQ